MQGTALSTDHLRFSRLSTSCSPAPSSTRSGLHVLCACMTSNMRSALAEARSIHYTTASRLCGNKPRQTKPRTRVSLIRQKLDSVPHTLLLHRLLQCGITGAAFAVLLAKHSPASSRVHVGSALSFAFAAQCGVARRCPLFPLLYAIFVDHVLQSMQAVSHPDLSCVGPAAARRKLVGQADADDLSGIAATQ